MSIHADMKNRIKELMLKKDQLGLLVVKSLVAAFQNELVAKGRKPQGELSDDEALAVIKRATKQHKDSIEQFEKGGRPDLVENEAAELKILEQFLPKSMSRNEIKPLVEKKKAELGITDKSKAGQLMSAVMKELKGKADGADVKAVVDEMLG